MKVMILAGGSGTVEKNTGPAIALGLLSSMLKIATSGEQSKSWRRGQAIE